MSRVGSGIPDVMVYKEGLCILIEIKTEKGKLNQKQKAFHEQWTECTFVVRTPMEAIEAVLGYVKNHPIR